jgi:uncharacterized protein
MVRLLLLALAVLILVWMVRRALRPPQDRAPRAAPGSAAELVACAHCGVLLPRAEAREAAGGLYCGDAHARLGPRRP